MYNSHYTFYSDSVPFLQIVLKGYMDYYAPLSNFFANKNEQILHLIDYGMYPSFIVTHEPTYKLQYTNANDFFTTQYSDWKTDIIDQYQTIYDALQPVVNSTITSRDVLSPGIVQVQYSNGTTYIINYTETDFVLGDLTVGAKDYYRDGGN